MFIFGSNIFSRCRFKRMPAYPYRGIGRSGYMSGSAMNAANGVFSKIAQAYSMPGNGHAGDGYTPPSERLTPEQDVALAQAATDYQQAYGPAWNQLEKERAFSQAKRANPEWYEGNRYIGGNVADHLAWREQYPQEAAALAESGELPSIGLIRRGNIMPGTRVPVQNEDGSYSTVRSMSFEGPDGHEWLIPTTAEDGSRILSDEEAIEQAKRTGHILGVFDSPDAATNYAKAFHDRDAYLYDHGLDTYSRRKKW